MKKLYLSFLIALFSIGVSSAQQLKDSFEVFFELNKSDLRATSKTTIDSFLDKSKGRRLKLRVTGHTCDIGADNYNLGLSEKRAISAFDYLKSKGEQEDKIELFFYGEKELKYGTGGKAENRRVFVLFALEDDDRDTLLKRECLEIFVEKGTYKPNKNKVVSFDYKTFNDAAAIKAAKIKLVDLNGNRYVTNGIAYFDAKLNGAMLEPGKTLKMKMPSVAATGEGYTLFTGVEKDGFIVWKSTGRPCPSIEKNANCNTYNFDMQVNGYCACLKQTCPEDCNPSPFGENRLASPDMKDPNNKSTESGVVMKIQSEMFVGKESKAEFSDDLKFEEDMDVCEQFQNSLITNEWFPSYYNIHKTAIQNVTFKGFDDKNNLMKNQPSKTVDIYVPISKMKQMQTPSIVVGNKTPAGYVKWNSMKNQPDTCLGPINCEYYVFRGLQGSGYYKLGDWTEKKKEQAQDSVILKTRVIKNSDVLVGNKETNFVYRAENAKNPKNKKTKEKEYIITNPDEINNLVILIKNENGKKKLYAEIRLTDQEIKFKAKKKMYVLRKKFLKKVADFKDIQLSKCKN